MSSIHNRVIDEAQKSHNAQMLNEILTRTIIQARKDLKELSRLKKKELGPKSVLYTNNLLGDSRVLSDSLNSSKEEGNNESDDKSYMKNIFRKPRTSEIPNLQFSDNQAINQLTEHLTQKENELKRKAVMAQNLKEIFARSRNLIENLWEEMHISPQVASEFSKKYFYPETIMNYVHIFQEISRLCKIRGIQHEVLTFIEQREVYIQRLRKIAQQLLTTNKRSADSIYEDTLITNEVPDIIHSLRIVSVKIILRILHWRDRLPKRQPFVYNSHNYILKMRNDMDFLKLTPLGPYLEKCGIPLESNPLLLPTHCVNERFRSSQRATDQSHQKHGSSFPGISKHAQHGKSASVLDTSKHHLITQIKNSKIVLEQGEKLTEDCVRIDRVIFIGEDKFLNELRELEIKERAATKIQCFVRLYMAKKIVKHLKKERYPRTRRLPSVEQQAELIAAKRAEEEKSDLEKEIQSLNDRLECSLMNGDMIGYEGRFTRKIFHRKGLHD